MKKQPFNFDVQIPDLIDFGTRFPQYGPFARENGNFMFDEIMIPSSFIRCKCASEFNLPAVTGCRDML